MSPTNIDNISLKQVDQCLLGCLMSGMAGKVLACHQTSNLGVGGSKPSERANEIKGLIVLCRVSASQKSGLEAHGKQE